MGDATGLGCSKVGGAQTGACIDNGGKIDNDRLEGARGEVNIVAREKQIDADGKIYYAIYPSENGTFMTSDRTNKIFILISF